jgi:glycosyltransferase involved in cell wall biosynthesis
VNYGSGNNGSLVSTGSAHTHAPSRDAELARLLISREPDGTNGTPPDRRRQARPRVSVIIPAVNEEANLPFVLPQIGTWIDEVILVDGNSVDRTAAVASSLLPDVRLVQQPGRGKGDALRAGFEAAQGDIIVMLDADGSTDPREIPLFVGALAAGAEFVRGTRFAQGAGTADMSFLRRCGNRLLVRAVRALFGGHCSDLCYGYVAFWKRLLPQLAPDVDGFEIETQMTVRALGLRLRVAEVPSFEFKRIHGKSNLRTMPDGWRVLKTILRERIRLARLRRRLLPQDRPLPALNGNGSQPASAMVALSRRTMPIDSRYPVRESS